MPIPTQLPSTEEILSAYQDSYGTNRTVTQVSLVFSKPKIRKLIVEYLVTYRNQHGEWKQDSLIGKLYADQKEGLLSYQFLQYLWKNGFNTDPNHTIVRPIAFLQPYGMLIMSKSPGKTLDDWIHGSSVNSKQLALLIAGWLTRMHAIPIKEIREGTLSRANAEVGRYYRELSELLPAYKSKLKAMYDVFVQNSHKLGTEDKVLLHGDFHTRNVFIDAQQVIAIDFDQHFAGDPAWEVAYMASHVQVSSFFKNGNFDYFQSMIQFFIDKYLDNHPSFNRQAFLERVSLYSARTLFESLHYDLCILKTGNLSIVDPFFIKYEQNLQGGGFK